MRFAKAGGFVPNDQMDAKVLAEFGQANPTRVVGQSCKMLHVLKQLVMLRRQLVCQRARLQLEHADVTMVQVIDRNIKNLDKELKDVQKMIQDQIDADPARAGSSCCNRPPVRRCWSASCRNWARSIAESSRHWWVSRLFDDQSGDNEHKRHIKGGRATVRSALYMATLVGIRHDPVLKGHYQNLVARGKPKKVAIVACMNKRLNYLNSLVRQPTPAK